MTRGEPAIVCHEYAGKAFRVRELRYPAGLRQGPHAHEGDGVTLVLGGGILETVGRHEEVATCLSVVIKPAGVVHADRVGPRGARTLQILLDSDRSLSPPGDGDLGPWRWIHAGPGARALLSLHRLLAGAPATAEVEDHVLDAVGAVAGEAIPAGSDPPAWLRRVWEAVRDRAPETPTVRDLAADAGVHPVSLTRAFRRHFGTSLTVFRRRERLRRAVRAIERTESDLTRIAHASGFSDQSHMCREVRAATGLTPGELRRLTRFA